MRTLFRSAKQKRLFQASLLLFVLVNFFSDTVFGLCYVFVYSHFMHRHHSVLHRFERNFSLLNSTRLTFVPDCACKGDSEVVLTKERAFFNVQVKNHQKANLEYSLPEETFKSSVVTCDWYNALRRGQGVKVLSFSLYGKNSFYYYLIRDIAELAKQLYPSWIIRVHHDNSIDMKLKCELECHTDNLDFCNVEKLPYDLYNLWSASYMHGMSWRWLPIGDSFVSYFSSRDSDSPITQREVDSVNVWLQSSTKFHIMRDHPHHGAPILGGMWGFSNSKDSKLARYLFEIITNPYIAKYYNPGKQNAKGNDQFMLGDLFYHHALGSSTTHDSYTCRRYGGEPFPSKRGDTFCFVGCQKCCQQAPPGLKNLVCPSECRPREHPDWIYC